MGQVAVIFRGLVASAILVAIGALIVTNPIVLGVVGGVLRSRGVDASMVRAYHERNFHRECQVYKDASTWERLFDTRVSSVRWCKGYLDRL
jgi:hypothetical protein